MKQFKVNQIGRGLIFSVFLGLLTMLSFSIVQAQPTAITEDDFQIGGIEIYEPIDKVVEKYGQPDEIKERKVGHAKMGFDTEVSYIYQGLLEFQFSKRSNQILMMSSIASNIHTSRGIVAGNSVSDMIKAYGNKYSSRKSSEGTIFYEYSRDKVAYVLSFEIDPSTQEILKISVYSAV